MSSNFKPSNPTQFSQLSRQDIRQQQCPKCGARPGSYCSRDSANPDVSHKERMSAAQKAKRDALAAFKLVDPKSFATAAQLKFLESLSKGRMPFGVGYASFQLSKREASHLIDAIRNKKIHPVTALQGIGKLPEADLPWLKPSAAVNGAAHAPNKPATEEPKNEVVAPNITDAELRELLQLPPLED